LRLESNFTATIYSWTSKGLTKPGVFRVHVGCQVGGEHEFIIERRLIVWDQHEK